MNFVVIILIIFTFLSRFIGLGREMFLAYYYGTSYISDAYLMSIAIPTIIITFVILSFATSYIPAYQSLDGTTAEKNIFTNKVMGFTLISCLLILVVTMIFTPQIVPFFVTGFDDKTLELTVSLTRISLFAIFFMGMNPILDSFMQVKEKVLLASLSGIPYNIIVILFIVISARTSVYMLAIGTVVALGMQFLFLLVLASRNGLKLRPRFDITDGTIRNLIILTLPIIVANLVEQIGIIVDKNLASTLGHGAVSSLIYANRITTAISGIFVTSILVVTFSKIAKQASNGNMTKMKNLLSESIVGMSLFLIPAIIAVATFAQPLVVLLFGRGAFDAQAVSVTSSLVFFYIFALFGSGLTQLISRVFYAIGDSKTPMIVAVATVVINIVLNFTLINFMGITGLALSSSLSAFIGMVLGFILLRRKIGSLRLRDTLISLNKIAGASIAMAFIAYFIYQYLAPFNATAALLVAAIIGVVIYVLLLLVLRIREMQIMVAFVLDKIEQFIKNRKGC